MGFTAFRLPGWDSAGVEAIPDARDDSADDEVREGERGTLQDCADNHDSRADENGFPSAESVSDKHAKNCAEEAAQIVGCDRYSLDCRSVLVSWG